MQIDWFVLLVQLVNFLILLSLLRRFLFTRITRTIDEREAKMIACFEEAERLKRKAEEAAGNFQEKQASLQVQVEKMLDEARKAAKRRQKELMDSARKEVETIRQRWVETILQEKEAFLESLRLRASQHVYAVVRRILAELADTAIEQKMIDVLIERIHSLDPKEGEAIRKALRDSGEGVMVLSDFPLTQEDRQRLAAAVRELTGTSETVISYQGRTDMISGVEFLACGHRISWSIGEYLNHLEDSFDHVLQEEFRQTLPKSL